MTALLTGAPDSARFLSRLAWDGANPDHGFIYQSEDD